MSELTFVKYCPGCDLANPKQQSFCLDCGEDISNITVEPRREELPKVTAVVGETEAQSGLPAATRRVPVGAVPEETECVLELLENPAVRFTVRDGQAVGRTDKADVVIQGVPKWDYISSRMARLFRRAGQWYIQHVAETNYIVVDGEKYTHDEEVAIYDGSIITIPLTAFRVSLKES